MRNHVEVKNADSYLYLRICHNWISKWYVFKESLHDVLNKTIQLSDLSFFINELQRFIWQRHEYLPSDTTLFRMNYVEVSKVDHKDLLTFFYTKQIMWWPNIFTNSSNIT